jgi:hypothetical protein
LTPERGDRYFYAPLHLGGSDMVSSFDEALERRLLRVATALGGGGFAFAIVVLYLTELGFVSEATQSYVFAILWVGTAAFLLAFIVRVVRSDDVPSATFWRTHSFEDLSPEDRVRFCYSIYTTVLMFPSLVVTTVLGFVLPWKGHAMTIRRGLYVLNTVCYVFLCGFFAYVFLFTA